jgi:hypothetical protein
MGISKQVEYGNTGIVLNYWRLNFVGVDIEDNTAKCRVGGYVSKSDALAGKRAIENIHFNFSGQQNPISLATDPREYQNLLYAKIIAEGTPFNSHKLVDGEIVSDLP